MKVREVIDRAVANRSGQNVMIMVNGEATAPGRRDLVVGDRQYYWATRIMHG